MDLSTQANETISSFYDGVLDADKWQEGLERLTRLAGCSKGGLMRMSLNGTDPAISNQVGHSPEAVRLYSAHFGGCDPLVPVGSTLAIGEWLNKARVLPNGAAMRTEYHNDFERPFDIEGLLGMNLVRDGGHLAFVSLQRSRAEGHFTRADEELLRPTFAHLQRATWLHFQTVTLRERADIASAVLESVQGPLWVTDENGRIVLCNSAAQQAVALQPVLRTRHGRLEAVHQAPALSRAILCAASAKAPRASWVMLAGSTAAMPPLVVLPLPASSPFGKQFQRPLAIVFARSTRRRRLPLTRLLEQLYGLTSSEAQLAVAVAEGIEVREYAAAAILSVQTVRGYLKSVFGKVGVRRQVDLCRVLLAMEGDIA